MSFEEYLMYIKHMSIDEFNQMSLGAKMQIEHEYDFTYGL